MTTDTATPGESTETTVLWAAPYIKGMVKRTCSVEGCNRPYTAKGFCNVHYYRMKYHGRPHRVLGLPGSGYTRPNDGYVEIQRDGVRKLQHQLIAENALGKPLPKGAAVHHVDGNKANNDPCNLVVCPDAAYHNLLHKRADALEACGHADWLKCQFCKQYDDPQNMAVKKRSDTARKSAHGWHRECRNKHLRDKYKPHPRKPWGVD